MKVNWENEKENLSQMINDKISYAEIGRYYNITGNAVKKSSKKVGISIRTKKREKYYRNF